MSAKTKHVLITGASSGIGEALAYVYAVPGATLTLNGRHEQRLYDVAQTCRKQGADVYTKIVDVRDREAMSDWMLEADRLKPVDLVIANAGISGGPGNDGIVENSDQIRDIFAVNLDGALNTIEPILPIMLQRKSGQIAVMSSLAGFRGWPGAPAYSASKGAVRFYGEALRGSLKNTGVKVNVICPGFVRSRMTDVNEFPMPFMIPAGKAADIIARGLEKNRGRIAFPWQTHVISWFLSVIPDSWAQQLLSCLPSKR